jgi:anaerobic selenocysteine-containing dehydrogenase
VAPAPLLADLGRLAATLDPAAAAPHPEELRLISRRTLRSNSSWMHNSPRLVAGKPRCCLEMHPADAAARGLTDGQKVRLTSRVGAVEVPLTISDRVRPGVVCLPHGWGHDREGSALGVAGRRPGASLNDVCDDAPVDVPTGTSALNQARVTVTAV